MVAKSLVFLLDCGSVSKRQQASVLTYVEMLCVHMALMHRKPLCISQYYLVPEYCTVVCLSESVESEGIRLWQRLLAVLCTLSIISGNE